MCPYTPNRSQNRRTGALRRERGRAFSLRTIQNGRQPEIQVKLGGATTGLLILKGQIGFVCPNLYADRPARAMHKTAQTAQSGLRPHLFFLCGFAALEYEVRRVKRVPP